MVPQAEDTKLEEVGPALGNPWSVAKAQGQRRSKGTRVVRAGQKPRKRLPVQIK